MKKIIVFAAMLATAASVSAQKKGEMYIKGAFGISGGDYKSINTIDGSTTSTSNPSTLTFNIAPEFGYFVANNVKLAIELSYDLTKMPNGKDGDQKLYEFRNNVYITPNVEYYIKISDKFFYTPGVDIYLGFGNQKTQTNASSTVRAYSTTSFGFRLNLIAFEFRANKHFAFTADFGNFGFASVTKKTSNTDKQVSNIANLNLKSLATQIGVQYYF